MKKFSTKKQYQILRAMAAIDSGDERYACHALDHEGFNSWRYAFFYGYGGDSLSSIRIWARMEGFNFRSTNEEKKVRVLMLGLFLAANGKLS